MGIGAEKRQCLSPAPFSAHRKLAQICPRPARNPSLGLGCCPPSKDGTQRLTEANTGYFCAEVLRDDTTSLRKRMCAFSAYVRFLRRRGPAGLRSLFFGYSVVIFAPPCSLSQTWKHSCSNGWTQRSLKFARKQLKILLLGRDAVLSPKAGTLRLTRANKWCFCMGCLWGNTTNRRQKMCAFTACGHFLQRCSP